VKLIACQHALPCVSKTLLRLRRSAAAKQPLDCRLCQSDPSLIGLSLIDLSLIDLSLIGFTSAFACMCAC